MLIENQQILTEIIVDSNSILDSTTSKELMTEQRFCRCKTFKSLSYAIANSAKNYSKNHN